MPHVLRRTVDAIARAVRDPHPGIPRRLRPHTARATFVPIRDATAARLFAA